MQEADVSSSLRGSGAVLTPCYGILALLRLGTDVVGEAGRGLPAFGSGWRCLLRCVCLSELAEAPQLSLGPKGSVCVLPGPG